MLITKTSEILKDFFFNLPKRWPIMSLFSVHSTWSCLNTNEDFKWRYWKGQCVFIAVAMISRYTNNVYIFAILRALTWLDCVFFPWVKGTAGAPLQWARVRWGALMVLRCVCAVYICTRRWLLLMLDIHSDQRGGLYSGIEAIFAFICVQVRHTFTCI